jgi:hypothetical protein
MTTTLTEPQRQTARAALDQFRAARQNAAAQARALMEVGAALKGRHAALALDAQLGLAGAADERVDVAARLAAVVAELEEQRQLVAEVDRREPEAIEALHRAALAEGVLMLAKKEAEVDALVAQIRREREHTPPEVLEHVVIVARQAAGLRHDLLAATSNAIFARGADLRAKLGEDAAALVPDLQPHPYLPKVPIERPWAALLDDLAEGRP